MRRLALSPLLLLTGCLFDNEISGDWSLGGQGGCAIGQDVYVEVPDYDGPIVAERFACARGGFAIGVPSNMHDFRVELWVENRNGPDAGHAEVELRAVTGDFDLGHVAFQPLE